MYSVRKTHSRIYWALVIAALLLWTLDATAFGQAGYYSGSETCESKSDTTATPTNVTKSKSPLVQQMQAARLAGDMDLVRELDSRIERVPSTGESAGGTVLMPVTSVGGDGNLAELIRGFCMIPGSMTLPASFGEDVLINEGSFDSKEIHATLASDSSGNLYTAVQDDTLSKDYIQIYRSMDSGKTWDGIGYVSNATADLVDPCIAVGDGIGDTVFVAYIVDDGTNDTYPEIARKSLPSGSVTVHSVPIWTSGEGYAKPVIWTDSTKHFDWYAYMTCEWIYDAASDNINVACWRCTDGGTWGNEQVIFGDFDTHAWLDPDGSYGTGQNNNYICTYDDTDNELHVAISDNDGATYDDFVEAEDVTAEPDTHRVDPEIEAAITEDNVMMVFTGATGGEECIRQGYSTNAGSSWTTFWIMDGTQPIDEFAPALCANQAGGNWHLVYTSDHNVKYTKRPQDLSDYWESTHLIVDDADYASHTHSKKGITTHWLFDVCGVVWADYRNGTSDYDIYYDFTRNNKVYVPTDYSSIQSAIDAVPGGFEVLVEPGRYNGNINFNGKPITLKSTEGAMWTFLDGMRTGSTVTFDSGEKYNSVIEGFTIHNGDYPSGGGINVALSTPTIRNNVIIYNYATYGAGIFCYNCSPTMINNTIYNNSAGNGGGGLYVKGALSAPQTMNSIFWSNDSASGADEIGVEAGSPTVTYSCIDGGYPGYGNISSNPKFVRASECDFHISWDSPCRDAGFSAPPSLPATDFEGDPRTAFGDADMGADEFHRHFYYNGKPYPNGHIRACLVDVPGSNPVGFWFGAGISDPPYHHPVWGNWYLLPPYIFLGPFGSIPADGVMELDADIPATPPAPYEAYLQAYIGGKFTNLMILRIVNP